MEGWDRRLQGFSERLRGYCEMGARVLIELMGRESMNPTLQNTLK